MRKLRVFRMENGVRTPYVIELDSALTVLREYPAATAASEDRRSVVGLSGMVDPRSLAAWASRCVEENPIPGSDELREEYFEERRILLASYEAAGADCPGCELGALQRRYRDKLEAAGYSPKTV